MRQTHPFLSVVVVDDQSEEGHRQSLYEALSEFPDGFVRILDGDGRGLSAGRNIGAAAADSEIVMFLDDDDYLLPDAVEKMLKAMRATDSDFVTSGYRRFRTEEFSQAFADGERNDYLGLGQEITAGLIGNVFGPAMCMTRKSALQIVGGYSPGAALYEDWNIYLNASLIGLRLEHVAEPLFLYRDTPDSMSKTGNHHAGHAWVLTNALERCGSAVTAPLVAIAVMNINAKAERIRRWSAIDARLHQNLFRSLNTNLSPSERSNVICELLNKFDRPETAFEYTHYSLEKGRLATLYPKLTQDRKKHSAPNVLENIAALCHQADLPYHEAPQHTRKLIRNVIADLGASDSSIRLLAMKFARSALRGGRHEEALSVLLEVASYHMNSAVATGIALCFDGLEEGDLAASYRDKAEAFRGGVEEKEYIARYEDVRKAIDSGNLRTGLEHFLSHGRKEGRVWDYFDFWEGVPSVSESLSTDNRASNLPTELDMSRSDPG